MCCLIDKIPCTRRSLLFQKEELPRTLLPSGLGVPPLAGETAFPTDPQSLQVSDIPQQRADTLNSDCPALSSLFLLPLTGVLCCDGPMERETHAVEGLLHCTHSAGPALPWFWHISLCRTGKFRGTYAFSSLDYSCPNNVSSRWYLLKALEERPKACIEKYEVPCNVKVLWCLDTWVACEHLQNGGFPLVSIW